ncbi:MarR family winged helix-turn-helix transcriptional regulator [Sphingomonas bacterium]|uniref:MarR family winged helix-turn-helix transcriptional regulator n=1 Tax=Sphingomonas bacterium TaxID=1895847 RepID=UPI002631B54E|nr:MarR family transcriptional regulator [Sphingomonas bacterium]MDB5678583.1 MarR family transcriptional regulator [Sphingomonas bacterium]
MTAAAIREKHDGGLDDRASVRLWLRLLSCTMVIEKRVRRRLDERFSTTLPRFDVLAALDRNGAMTMGALSQALLVSKGNVTALVQTLKAEGLVAMTPSATDRRASIVRLTPKGVTHFTDMAEAHHRWIDAMLAALGAEERAQLFALLGRLKTSIAAEEMPA